jgi:hypothetical protein
MATTIKIANVGLALITALLKGSTHKYIGWGIGTTAANVANTALESAGAEARATGTQDDVQTTVADDTYQVIGTITCAGAGKAITEACVFSADTNGTLLVRAVFDAVNVAVGDSIQFTIKIAFVSG